MRRIFGMFAAIGLCAALSLCERSGAFAAADGWGNVKGAIVWGGDKAPERPPIDLKANPDKMVCLKNGAILDETWIVNAKSMGLKNTFVWLQPKEKGAKMPIHPDLADVKIKNINIDQPSCMFIPHAIALREGQALVAKNTSGISHNYKWSGHPDVNPGGNVLLPPNATKEIADLKADRFPVSVECNIHPWMKGWVRVYDHPYYAVTDENGGFEFKKAPAGEWRLMVWHGSGGWLGGKDGRNGQPVTIKAGETNDLGKLKYPPPKE
jgi:hypothetical protein